MSHDAWLVVAICGIGTVALKTTGPLLLGGRDLPGWVGGVLALLAPTLLAALIVTQAFAGDRVLVLDARAAGLAAAAIALALRAPLLVVLVLAAAVAAGARALGWLA
ncbi:MAG: branched-chain amino acid transporter AzlD [Solirubrobacterales bacterium]|nr:branched-chain amino acid transporter AzlD [Solirubrobacterales bacterium]